MQGIPNRSVAPGVALLIAASACGGTSGFAATELASILERDGVPFDGSAIPDEVLLRLADHRWLCSARPI